jgi:hypothetical protein
MDGTKRARKWIVIEIIMAGRLQDMDEAHENPVEEGEACF